MPAWRKWLKSKQVNDSQGPGDSKIPVPERIGPELGNGDKEPHHFPLVKGNSKHDGSVGGEGARGAGSAIQVPELVNSAKVTSQNCVDQWPALFADGKTNIRFDNGDVWSFCNQVKGSIEDFIGVPVSWWPLSPRRKALPEGFSRVRWICVCGDHQTS